MSYVRRSSPVGLAFAIVAAYGCGGTPPENPTGDPKMAAKTGVTIEGQVTLNGQPLPGGYVVAWAGNPLAHGEIGKDGRYTIFDAPGGKVHLTVSVMPPIIVGPKMGPGGDPKGGPPMGEPTGDGPKFPPGFPGGEGQMGGGPPGFPPGMPKGGPPGIGGPGGSGPPPVAVQILTPEEKTLVEAAGKKYGDPTQNLFPVEASKGNNRFDLPLTSP